MIDHPFAAAYATGEMAFSTAGAVMTGTRNAYEVAFHGKQLKSAAFETALAFGALKYGAKAIRGVSRLVSRGVGVKKLTLVGGKGTADAYRGLMDKKVQQITDRNVRSSLPIGNRNAYKPTPQFSSKNAGTKINGRQFSGHALDEMRNQGIMPTIVENAIKNGEKALGRVPGTSRYYDTINNISVIVNDNTHKVITAYFGKIK